MTIKEYILLLRADKTDSSSDETKEFEFEAIPEAIVGWDDLVRRGEGLRQSWRD